MGIEANMEIEGNYWDLRPTFGSRTEMEGKTVVASSRESTEGVDFARARLLHSCVGNCGIQATRSWPLEGID